MSECNCKNILNLQAQSPVTLNVQPKCTPQINIDPKSGSQIIMDTAYHNRLLNRDLTDQHPISAITDLQESLDTLQNGIEAEEARAKAAEESLSDDIQAENTRAINAEEALQDNIDAEEERAIRAEQAEANTRSIAISRLEGYISAEITDRISADNTLQGNINTEKTARENADTTLQSNIDAEALTRQNADTTLQSNIDAEALTRENADTALNTKIDNHIADKENPHQVTKAQVGLGNVDNTADIDKPISTAVSAEFDAVEAKIADINSKIPNAASSTNQLADKEFVNSSISTNTANFIGTFNSVAELKAYSGTLTNNDYAFVVRTDSAGNTIYDRYKYTDSTTPASWEFEYELNNSSFTAAQWNAINSGATTELVNQITTNQGNITTIQTTIGGYGNIVTHNVSEFATAAQGTKADTAVQPADLATVATSGSYNDLDDKPTIGNATLTIQKNGTAVDTFTANATADKAINITVPTDTNDLTNGAGYITGITSSDVTTALGYTPYNSSNPSGYQTASDVQTAIAGKQDTLVSGTNIKTINSNSILGSGNLNIDGLPSQTGQNGKFLSTDGTNPSWQNVDALPSQTGQGGKFLTTNGTEASWGAIGGGLEIGDIGFAPLGIDETKNKRRYLNGQVISQAQFVSFTNKIKSAIELYPNLATSETNWQATVTNSKLGQCGKFVIDNTAGTIRLPKVVNINGLTNLSLLGGIKAESLPNITGGLTSVGDLNATGAFYLGGRIGTRVSYAADGDRYSALFDSSRSSSTYQDNAPVQQEAIQYPYFIQVATGSEESVDVSTEIQLNNPFSLLDYKWSEYELSNASWLISNGSFHSGATYPAVYELLLKIYNGTETKDGVSVKLSTEAYTDTDFVLNTADTTFRLPIKVKLASGNAAAGNGMTLGLTDGTNFGGTVFNAQSTVQSTGNAYGQNVGTLTKGGTGLTGNTNIGITTDPTKSGIETSSDGLYLYFYVGETIQDANIIAAASVLTKVANCIDRTVASDRETVVGWGMPDYSAKVVAGRTGNTFMFVSPSKGFISLNGMGAGARVKINDIDIGGLSYVTGFSLFPNLIPLDVGDNVNVSNMTADGGLYFFPCKGVN